MRSHARDNQCLADSNESLLFLCVCVGMLSREFAIAALLTADFCLCGVFLPQMREMRLNRIGVDNQAIVRGRFGAWC